MVCSSCWWVVLSFFCFFCVVLGFTGFHFVEICFDWILLGFTGFYQVFTGFHLKQSCLIWVLPGFTGFYRVSLSNAKCNCFKTWFKWALLGFTRIN